MSPRDTAEPLASVRSHKFDFNRYRGIVLFQKKGQLMNINARSKVSRRKSDVPFDPISADFSLRPLQGQQFEQVRIPIPMSPDMG